MTADEALKALGVFASIAIALGGGLIAWALRSLRSTMKVSALELTVALKDAIGPIARDLALHSQRLDSLEDRVGDVVHKDVCALHREHYTPAPPQGPVPRIKRGE